MDKQQIPTTWWAKLIGAIAMVLITALLASLAIFVLVLIWRGILNLAGGQ